jgi:hypothetical protein
MSKGLFSSSALSLSKKAKQFSNKPATNGLLQTALQLPNEITPRLVIHLISPTSLPRVVDNKLH